MTLNNSATVRARIYNSVTLAWSPLIEPEFIAGIPASAANLVISTIHYHPATAGGLEQFVELLNIGANPIDLSNVRFMLGIQFNFPFGYLIAPGARVLIVRDTTAFNAAYPGAAGQVVGIFANGTTLDTGGERLQLLDAANGTIRDFSYNNKDPWPESPDGGGPCLVLKRPTTNPDHSLGANWRASYSAAGSPGVSDALTYSAWATTSTISDPAGTGDDDGDGLKNFVEYGLGANPHQPSASSLPVLGTQNVNVSGVVSTYLTLTYTRTIGRDDVSYAVEASTDLGTWVAAIIVGAPSFIGNGIETLTYRHPNPKSADARQFLRLGITKLP